MARTLLSAAPSAARLAGGEPAPDRRLDQRRHPADGRDGDALVPRGRPARCGRGIAVAEHQAAHPVRIQHREAQRRDRAHRHANDDRPVDGERIEQQRQILGQPVEIAGQGRDVRFAMAALVVAQDTKVIAQCRDLIVPEGEVGHQRIAEHQPRGRGRAVDAAPDRQMPDGDEAIPPGHRHQPRW
jgi:hypothetical protein